MEFSIKNGNPEKQRNACVIVGVFEHRKLSDAAGAIDRAADGYLSSLLRRGDMDGKLGSTLLVHNVPGTLCERVLLVGCGKEREFNDRAYRQAVLASVKALDGTGASDAASFLAELTVRRRDLGWRVEQMVEITSDAAYRFAHPSCKKEEERRGLSRLIINVPQRNDLKRVDVALKRGLAIAGGARMAKDLGNLPGNICTPTYLAQQAQELAKSYNLEIEVLERDDMEKLGMGSLLSVARGSRQPPKLIVLQYRKGKASQKPLVLIGKGITFDAGGISLKPAAEMDEMKYDMCGAASVLGTMKAVAEMDLAMNLVVIVPTCENLPDGDANKPGDIVTSMSGQTIEVLNTDAEGRLILCDAMTYAERFEPEAVVDVATLTGACVIALGHHVSGLFGNEEGLVKELTNAGDESFDRVWAMPLLDEYQDQLKSNFADMANIGGRAAGSITAACFLSRFAKKYNWAHLDIAGTAWKSGKDKGATGRPVPLLAHFLLKRGGHHHA
ncbi:leucyl aminopeptidase [Novimethylophilus kurashikiensis]|uniref:Probable cytosol aminopeptidase n=1 Tax=Novimethylophilus kurashikiensis TaxID=1825523 RepID=A0A2R5FA87_9PROT|nr:leucyl aminopeptidase [Novimethylophilus kurashikiensis]GBG13554.1 leucyl aminopeptidase [Novimethylophilus kurashikiensis]